MNDSATTQRISIIMAGGSGERFWPLSRHQRPKQLLKLVSPDKTLLEEAVERMLPLIPADRLFIATNEGLRDAIRDMGLPLPVENVLAEPCKRNTAGCLSFVAAHCLHRFGDAAGLSLAITTADHFIGEPEAFQRTMLTALNAVEREPALGVVGIRPTRPETGFGYIEVASSAPDWQDPETDIPVYAVRRFREKPSRETAEDFLSTGRFYWNSGMFFWRLSTFLHELEQVHPESASAIHSMAQALGRQEDAKVREVFEGLEDISIDYALLERAQSVVMIPATFPWDDIGAWDALDRTRQPDERGNILVGDPVLIESEDCVVYNDAGPERIVVGVAGVEGLAVVVTSDAVLVISKDRAQEVRQVIAELKKRGAAQL